MTIMAAPITKYWSTISKKRADNAVDEKDTEVKSKIKGDLRSRIIQAFGISDNRSRVFITEIKTFTGRDTTQEKWHSFMIYVHSKREVYDIRFVSSPTQDSFNSMLAWLDEKAPI